MAGPNWTLLEDYQHVILTLATEPPTRTVFDTEAVEDILKNLGELRAYMKPEVPTTYALGQKVNVVADPAWATEPDLLMGDTLLHIRDPRYGWLHYMIPREEARRLAGFLKGQVEAPPPGQESGKAS